MVSTESAHVVHYALAKHQSHFVLVLQHDPKLAQPSTVLQPTLEPSQAQ